MPAYTTTEIREFIDDLDAVIRRGVTEGIGREVFWAEMGRIVSVFFPVHIFFLTIKIELFDECSQRMPERQGAHDRSTETAVRMANVCGVV
jgi:hypothetical protein